MLFGKECGGDLGVGLGHGVAIDHTSHMPRITWHLLASNHVCGTCHPVLRPLTLRPVDILVHLSTSWQVDLAHHALFESDSAHIDFIATRLVDFAIDRAGSLPEQIVL